MVSTRERKHRTCGGACLNSCLQSDLFKHSWVWRPASHGMGAFPCPSCDLWKRADRGKSQNEMEFFLCKNLSYLEQLFPVLWKVTPWNLGTFMRGAPRPGVWCPGPSGDCLPFPCGSPGSKAPVLSRPASMTLCFLSCQVRRLSWTLSKLLFGTESVRCMCAFTGTWHDRMYPSDFLSWTLELLNGRVRIWSQIWPSVRPIFLATVPY